MTALQEKDRLKKEKDEAEAKYKHALVDGRKEQVRAQQTICSSPIRKQQTTSYQDHCCAY